MLEYYNVVNPALIVDLLYVASPFRPSEAIARSGCFSIRAQRFYEMNRKVCIITGFDCCATAYHILPLNCSREMRELAAISDGDVNSARNCLIWLKGFETMFHESSFSVVPLDPFNPLQHIYTIKCWTEQCRNAPVCQHHLDITLRQFEGLPINFPHDKRPYTRVLNLQLVCAQLFQKRRGVLDNIDELVPVFGTPPIVDNPLVTLLNFRNNAEVEQLRENDEFQYEDEVNDEI